MRKGESLARKGAFFPHREWLPDHRPRLDSAYCQIKTDS